MLIRMNVYIFFPTGWGRAVGGGAAADTMLQGMLPVTSHSRVIKGTPTLSKLMKGAWCVPEVEHPSKLAVAKGTVVARSYGWCSKLG